MIIIRTFKDTDKIPVIKLLQDTLPTLMTINQIKIPEKIGVEGTEFLYIAEKSGQIVGYCKVFYEKQQGWLYSVANSPQLNDKGIDFKLIQHAASQLKKLNQNQQSPLHEQKIRTKLYQGK